LLPGLSSCDKRKRQTGRLFLQKYSFSSKYDAKRENNKYLCFSYLSILALIMKNNMLFYALLSTLAFVGCSSGKADSTVSDINQSVKKEFVPDGRTKIYDVKCTPRGGVVTVKGVTTSKEAKEALISRLQAANKKVNDSISLLPAAKLGENTYGIVDLSVCNIRSTNDFSAEMSLQGLLGQPVRVLDDQDFYRVQTPDLYIGWVLHAGITKMDKAHYDAWNRAEKIIITSHYGFTYARPDMQSQVVSDVVSGDRLKWEGTEGNFYKVSYPDGRTAFVSKTLSMTEREWRSALRQDAASIVRTAYTLMGIPYVWGCNSAKGADCSGFVRTVLFLHDIIIPRDASQMAYIGQHIDIVPECANLQPGDLVFFGRKAENGKKEHVSHVALYVGNQRFIHSMGDVHESSFNPRDTNYDAYNLGRRLWAVRFLPLLNKEADINTTVTNSFYK
jgi:cell wall-associated NlpC family hydrolase